MSKQIDSSTAIEHQYAAAGNSEPVLPDFCRSRAVLSVLVVAELLSILLALGSQDTLLNTWQHLSILSLFVLWIALLSAGGLCVLRRITASLGTHASMISGFFTVMLITLLGAELAWRIALFFGTGLWLIQGSHGDFIGRCLLIGGIVTALSLRYFYLQYQYRQQLRAEAEARVAALQARIRPHFLFNSLNTAASLIAIDPIMAEKTLEDLSELFRSSMRQTSALVPLGKELELCQRYLEIERLRLGRRLQDEWSIDVDEQLLVPHLILQPLLENAVYHGVETRSQSSMLLVKLHEKTTRVVIEVSNPLPPKNTPSRSKKGFHIAMENVRQRLLAVYGNEATMEQNSDDETYKVILTLPKKRSLT